MSTSAWLDDFDFYRDGALPFSRLYEPVLTAVAYLLFALGANLTVAAPWRRALATWSDASSWFIAWSALHNAFLIVFSLAVMGGIFVNGTALARERGFYALLCPPVADEGRLMKGRALAWAYLFYLIKFYELVDTLLLAIRGKNIIPLHIYHHLVMLPTMWSCFNGELLLCLLMASFFNSLVHVIMYTYYAMKSLKMNVPLALKKVVTRVQIVQFVMGALGGFTFVILYFQEPRLSFPYFTQGCAGEPYAIAATTCINLSFLVMFTSFFQRTYRRNKEKKVYIEIKSK